MGWPLPKLQGGSNMTGTDLYKRTHKSVPVIFEPPCILACQTQSINQYKKLRNNTKQNIPLEPLSSQFTQQVY